MKHSELSLDTVYADNDGRPLTLLSLDKFVVPKLTYGTRNLRMADRLDKSFGVVALRQSYVTRPVDLDALQSTSLALREDFPAKEQMAGDYEVKVMPLRLIVSTWEQHLEDKRQERARLEAAEERVEALRLTRETRIKQIEALLPEGISAAMYDYRGWAQVPLTQLLALATAAAPVEVADGAAFTPREMSLLAAGFDAAIATMRYEDGSPVEVVAVRNPYRVEATPGTI